jgi:hypothetical protein
MDGHVRRPGPDLPAGWLSQFSIVRLSGPSITTYTSDRKDPENNSTIYEMGSSIPFAERRNTLRMMAAGFTASRWTR